MVRLTWIVGWLLMAVGLILILSWLITPLRQLWPLFFALPLPVRGGLVLAAIGLLVLIGSLLWERWGEREQDRSLLDD